MPLRELLDSYNPIEALQKALNYQQPEELPPNLIKQPEPPKTTRTLLSEIEKEFPVIKPGTLLAVMAKETGGTVDPIKAVSSTGARGPFQHMPDFIKEHKITDPTNLEDAARGTARALSSLNKRFNGDWAKTFAAYHSGTTRVLREGLTNLGPVGKQYYQDILAHLSDPNKEIKVSKPFKRFLDNPIKE